MRELLVKKQLTTAIVIPEIPMVVEMNKLKITNMMKEVVEHITVGKTKYNFLQIPFVQVQQITKHVVADMMTTLKLDEFEVVV